MKAILEIPEKEIKVEFENMTYNQYRIIGSRPSEISPIMVEKYPIGKPITLVTSEMPDGLRIEIEKLIEQYCNH
jgi:hypothetical protein